MRNVRQRMIMGRQALRKEVGREAAKEMMAWTKFEGQSKAARADWWPYVVASKDGTLKVTSEIPTNLRGRWSAMQGVAIAESYAGRLLKGEKPFQPPARVEAPQDWPAHHTSGVIAVDVEGSETLDRIAISTGSHCGTFQWGPEVRHLVRRLLNECPVVLGWSVDYDVRMLEKEGVSIPESSHVIDLMVGHMILNPWRFKGLGKAAPLYVMVMPWKHLMREDPELYNVMDAAVLHPIWQSMHKQLIQRGQIKWFLEKDLPAWHKLRKMERDPVLTEDGDLIWVRYKPSENGAVNEDTMAGLYIEPSPFVAPSTDRYRSLQLGGWDFLYNVVSYLIGAQIRDHGEVAERYMLGSGPVQIRRGIKEYKEGPLLDVTPAKVKEDILWMDQHYPALKDFHDRVNKQAAKDRMVTNAFGRKHYAPKHPIRWVIHSTMADIIRHLLVAGPTPVHIWGDELVYESEEAVDPLALINSIPLVGLSEYLVFKEPQE